MPSDCVYCDGDGCSECDHTGRVYRQKIDLADGTTVSVTGSGEGLSPEAEQAVAEIARAAAKQLERPADE